MKREFMILMPVANFVHQSLSLTSMNAIIGALYHKLQYRCLFDSSLRWDALKAHQHNLTAFAYLRKHGVSIPSVTPVFPPITARYYWSIILETAIYLFI